MNGPAAARQWQDGGQTHIDVRGLPAPQPLVAILRLLGAASDDVTVVAHLDRDPVMLYPELAQIGWEAQRTDGAPDEVRLILRRTP